MMGNRKEFAEKFAEVLIFHLTEKYGKVPSASFFANQFNLRAAGTTTITSETARKWMKGLMVPEIDRFKILIEWLDFKTNKLFHSEDIHLTAEETNNVIDVIETKILDLADIIRKFKNNKDTNQN